MTTSFVDPLTFGSLSLTLGLLSLVLINLNDTESVLVSTYKLCGCGLGIYLSIISGSRTGWPAVPAVLLIWLLLRDRKRSILSTVVAIGAPVVLSVAAYYLSPAIQQKVALTANEFLAYRWNELNPDGSIPMRISFYRMALSLFIQQPFGGWGETSFLHAVNSPEFARYATQYTREFVKNGFHNEIMTAMVQSGVWGLISRVSIFLFPAMLFIRGSRSEAVPARKIALLSCCYLVCTFISGMSTEVFNLKFTASFHAFVITCLTGSLLAAMGSSENSKLSSGVVGKSQ
jgi:O-antigen ligase